MSEKVTRFKVPVELNYTIRSGTASQQFLEGIKEGRILGQRCSATGKVYVPARGPSPTTGLPMTDIVELPDTGIVTTFCVVNVPFEGQTLPLPYVGAAILLDGADIALFHLVGECDLGDVRMGMRVRAEWKPKDTWGYTAENIKYFKPTGEPDAPLASYKEHL